MALKLNIGKCTLLGNYRENNEDAIEVKHFPDLDVCIVADGMGGQAAGEVASKRAIEVIPRELRKALPGVTGTDPTKAVVRKAIVQANEEIIQMSNLDREMKNMGKTITPAEAKEHRFKNVLWKYLGTREVGEGPEVKPIAVQPGDRFLLCSDG